MQKVEYEWKPLRCLNCDKWGHCKEECRYKPKQQRVWLPKKLVGVTTVKTKSMILESAAVPEPVSGGSVDQAMKSAEAESMKKVTGSVDEQDWKLVQRRNGKSSPSTGSGVKFGAALEDTCKLICGKLVNEKIISIILPPPLGGFKGTC
ncbi:hypothetical protein Droror1_Dr00016613 [Drosera rotundifolia]